MTLKHEYNDLFDFGEFQTEQDTTNVFWKRGVASKLWKTENESLMYDSRIAMKLERFLINQI
jgi:hypothetical protein